MIGYFPHFYPNEISYSALARCLDKYALKGGRVTSQDLLGITTVSSTYLPSQLEKLKNSFPPTIEISVEEIIENHTVFPWYSPFLCAFQSCRPLNPDHAVQ